MTQIYRCDGCQEIVDSARSVSIHSVDVEHLCDDCIAEVAEVLE